MKNNKYIEFGYNSKGYYVKNKNKAIDTVIKYLSKLKARPIKYFSENGVLVDIKFSLKGRQYAIYINNAYIYDKNTKSIQDREFLESIGYKVIYLSYKDINSNRFRDMIINSL